MKKLAAILGMLLLSICAMNSFYFDAAISEDAALKGYEISDKWVPREYYEDAWKDINGAKYYEGSMSTWMEAYTLYHSDNNSMYVLILCTSSMQPNQKSYWDQKRWNNQQMRISMYPEIKDISEINLIDYAPKVTSNTIETSSGFSLTIGAEGEKLMASAALGYEQTIVSSEVTVRNTLKDYNSNQGADNRINTMYDFVNYKSNTKLENICCSLVTQNNFAIFKIKNYDENKKYKFYVENTNTFYRYGTFNTSSVSGTYTGQFTI